MNKIALLQLFFLFFNTYVSTQCIQNPASTNAYPKRDLRGVFIATVFNLNWPTNRLATPAAQQAELIEILDTVKANGYNTVFFQVRSECDALYNSALEPWSYRLTGTQGLAPTPLWDPLAFAITEAHNRGLDLHAWLNPYRASANVTSYTLSPNHVINTYPSWIISASNNGNLKILDPGLPAVQEYIKNIVQDIASRYDIDGIHFDDYFYPTSGMATNQDAATFAAHNPTGIATIADWRRHSVNTMIGKVYDALQGINASQNKTILFGVSPFGVWKSGIPTGITGTSSFHDMYCDPIAWLTAGKVDYLAPQLYWKITGAQDYITLSKWWNDQVAASGKQLYVSQGYYKLTDTNNWAASEIQNQIIQNRATSMEATFGQIAYNYSSIKNNDKTINTVLQSGSYQFKSFAPPVAGKDDICPNVPENIRFEGLYLKWDTPGIASDNDLPKKYVVYAFDSELDATNNREESSKILDIVAANQLLIDSEIALTKYFVVTSLDKNNNENGDFSQTLHLMHSDLNKENEIQVYPNPFENFFLIQKPSDYFGSLKIKLIDLSGKTIWQQLILPGTSVIKINPTGISAGFYFGKVELEDGSSKSFKISKE